MGDDIVEIYIHSLVKRERSHFNAIGYVAPKDNFIDIDTSLDTPEESFKSY